MNRKDIENRVRQIPWPAPSASLREKVLSAAVVTVQPISWSDRMWFSRAWRLAAVGATLAVVVLDQFSGAARSTGFKATPQAIAESRAIDEAGREVGLPPEVATAFARRALSEAPRARLQPHSVSELIREFTREGGGDER